MDGPGGSLGHDSSAGGRPPERPDRPDRPNRSWRALHLWEIQAVRDLLVIAVVVGIVWLGYVMRAVTTPLLVALALAYLFEPLVSRATERYRVSRPIVVGGLLAALFGLVALGIVLMTPVVLRQVSSMVDDVRTGRMVRAVERFEEVLPETLRGPWRSMLETTGLVDSTTGTAGTTAPDATGADGTGAEESGAEATRAQEAGTGATGTAATGSEFGSERDIADDVAPFQAQPDSSQRVAADVAVDSAADAVAFDEVEEAFTESEEERVRRIVAEELDRHGHHLSGAAPGGLGMGRYVDLFRRGIDTAWTVLGVLISAGLLAFLIPFYFYFFSVAYPAVIAFGESLIPWKHREQSLDLLRKMDAAVAGFVRGRLVISVIMSVLLAVGWYICGVPYSIVLGIVIGVFNLVPYLSGIGLPIALALLIFEQLGLPADERMSWFWILAGPTIVFVATQIIDGYVLTPIIAGKATNLDPVTILVAVLAGGVLAGFYGMLLAIPVAACLKIVIREILLPRVRAWTAGRARDPLPM